MTTTTPIRISLWSGPRNVSTALMYAFAQRNDTQVFDEPLYAHYLSKTDADSFHPGATDILQAQENDGTKVVHNLLLGESESPVVFFKNMAHHLVVFVHQSGLLLLPYHSSHTTSAMFVSTPRTRYHLPLDKPLLCP